MSKNLTNLKTLTHSSRIVCAFDALGHYYQKEKWIFRNTSATINEGEIFALLGSNGCGKTTLLNMIVGSLTPICGSLHLAGQPAFVPQLFELAFNYSVLDVVLMGRAPHIGLFALPSEHDKQRAMEALALFGLEDTATRSFSELSGGQRQLVIFARALVSEAKILVLDEPTAALDFKNQNLVLHWIKKLAVEQGFTVIFATHVPQHVLAVADKAMLMFSPDEYFVGDVSQALTEQNLSRLYGVTMKRVAYEHEGRQCETVVSVA
jgi:iron complex transport system ATP-binding protein